MVNSAYGIPGAQMAMPNIVIKKMLLIPTKERYQDVYNRSFTLGGNHATMAKLSNVLEQVGVGQNTVVSEAHLSKTIPEVISISPAALGVAKIPNGWGTQRLRFMLEVECIQDVTWSVYLQGYSEYHDPTLTGNIDPNMKFYINSITVVLRQYDPISRTYIGRPQSTFNVITDHFNNVTFSEVDDTRAMALLRPSDVVQNLNILEMYGAEQKPNIINASSRISSNNVHTSSRINNNPIHHFANTINSIIDAKNLANSTHNMADVYRLAQQNTVESKILNIPFIYALHLMTGKPTPSDFSLNNLLSIDVTVQNRITLVDHVNDMVIPTHNTMLDSAYTESTLQATAESVKAVNTAQVISSILTECMLATLDVSITNISGIPVIAVTNASTFIDGIDPLVYVNKARTKIEHVLIPKLTDNGYTLIDIYISANILGDTNISISLNRLSHVLFRFPTFADSLYIPVIADNITKDSLTDSYCNVIDMVNTMGNTNGNRHYYV